MPLIYPSRGGRGRPADVVGDLDSPGHPKLHRLPHPPQQQQQQQAALHNCYSRSPPQGAPFCHPLTTAAAAPTFPCTATGPEASPTLAVPTRTPLQNLTSTPSNDGAPESVRSRAGALGLCGIQQDPIEGSGLSGDRGTPLKRNAASGGLNLLSPFSLAASSVPDYDHDYPVMARIPSEDAFERNAPRLLNFLHSYAAHPGDVRRKQREEIVKRKWLESAIYQNPDGALYKQLLETPSSSDSDYEPTDVDLKQWLKLHKKRKRICERLQKRSQDEEGVLRNSKYKYKSWGILNRSKPISLDEDFDEREELRLKFRPEEVEAMIAAEKARLLKKRFAGAHVSRGSRGSSVGHQWGLQSSSSSSNDSSSGADNSDNSESESDQPPPPTETPPVEVKRGRKKKEKTPAQLAAEAALKRRKLWSDLCKKDAHRAFKHNQASRKESLHLAKKLAVGCMREVRKRALVSQKIARENASRSKRLCREMQALWKKFDRAEKDQRKRAEKEALEQLKVDAELREAKRQQRKLNFLITQTELYAHFMSRKRTGDEQDATTRDILGKLDHGRDPNDVDFDEEKLKSEALENARNAFFAHKQETDNFDAEFGIQMKKEEDSPHDDQVTDEQMELPQPMMFQGTLKSYQIKGMSWLYGLYDRGINGILADEMGLGKTVQTIAFLCALVERQSIWGPFLVIAPASTLHNWQQELSKFVPRLKVVPYWGNTTDRKVLRKFWSARNQDLHTEQSQFHVVVTSYQLVIQDVKFFQRIHWQYMVLDEAQAIKSTASQRWKVLLSFSCRNRLLLTGTPIQNAMQELWGLLHFIMPSLFDSHQEFNEWFSKDIESHAENKTAIDEKHLSRLHMILKPFMLRRIKKDVENELSDKIEIRIDCPLSQRQKDLCTALKKKIRIEDLMQSSGLGVGMANSAQAVSSATSCLMNIVMQFRKVCNHPDLFEREDVRSPFFMQLGPVHLPKKFFEEEFLLRPVVSRRLENIWAPANIAARSQPLRKPTKNVSQDNFNTFNQLFEFVVLLDLSAAEVSKIATGSHLDRLLMAGQEDRRRDRRHYLYVMEEPIEWFALPVILPPRTMAAASSLRELLFAVEDERQCFESTVTITPIPETPAHYEHRLRKLNEHLDEEDNGVKVKVEAIAHKPRPPHHYETMLPPPNFTVGCLMSPCISAPPEEITSDPRSYRWLQRAFMCGSREAFNWWHTGRVDMAPEHRETVSFMSAAAPPNHFGVRGLRPSRGWSQILIPNKERLVTQSGKLHALDDLLRRLKRGGHRVLIYSQMTRMIDLLEELMLHRRYIYIRLDGSSRISDRRDMVADFQERADIFVFLLSTRAGGLGINLTAADTVIFYDSDWNPTVDQQAMDRAHRLGQTKQVTVYRLICQGSIEERILERAREKSEIQRMVMSGTHMRPHDALKPKEVVSLLLDDDELERKFRQKQEERRLLAQQAPQQPTPASSEVSTLQGSLQESGSNAAETLMGFLPKRKRSNRSTGRPVGRPKKIRPIVPEDSIGDSVPASPASELSLCSTSMATSVADDDNDDGEGVLVIEEEPQRVPPDGDATAVTQSGHSGARKNNSKMLNFRPTLKPKRKRDRDREDKRKSTPAKTSAAQASATTPPPPKRPASTLPPAVQPVVAGAVAGGAVLDMPGLPMADTAFAWNDLNLDNLEEIDVNDIDLSSLDNVKV